MRACVRTGVRALECATTEIPGIRQAFIATYLPDKLLVIRRRRSRRRRRLRLPPRRRSRPPSSFGRFQTSPSGHSEQPWRCQPTLVFDASEAAQVCVCVISVGSNKTETLQASTDDRVLSPSGTSLTLTPRCSGARRWTLGQTRLGRAERSNLWRKKKQDGRKERRRGERKVSALAALRKGSEAIKGRPAAQSAPAPGRIRRTRPVHTTYKNKKEPTVCDQAGQQPEEGGQSGIFDGAPIKSLTD